MKTIKAFFFQRHDSTWSDKVLARTIEEATEMMDLLGIGYRYKSERRATPLEEREYKKHGTLIG